MPHIAYPNVLRKRFIGCGRYVALPPRPEETACRMISDMPDTTYPVDLKNAIQILAPDSFDAENRWVHEKKDRNEPYRGPSLALAYLLAAVSRAREFKRAFRLGPGDIWATGSVRCTDGTPALIHVAEEEFAVKMEAFLAPENPDPLFIVPTADVDDPELMETIRGRGARLLSLRAFRDERPVLDGSRKIVLKVLSSELPDLIDLIFDRHSPKPRRREAAAILAGIAALVILALVCQRIPTHRSIQTLLENGAFPRAEAQLNGWFVWPANGLEETASALATEVRIGVAVDIWRAGANAPLTFEAHDPALARQTVTHRDTYRLRLTADAPSRPLFLYLFQEDGDGNLFRLFPSTRWCPGLDNPVRPGEFPFSVPHITESEKGFYLDQRPADAPATSYRESFCLIASPFRALDLERLFGEVHSAVTPGARKERLTRFGARILERERAGLPSVTVTRFSFLHGG